MLFMFYNAIKFYNIFNIKDVYINWLKNKNTMYSILEHLVFIWTQYSRLQPAIWYALK